MNKFLKFLKLVGIPFIIALGIYTFIRFVWLKDENTHEPLVSKKIIRIINKKRDNHNR